MLAKSSWGKYFKAKFRALAARQDKIHQLLGGRKMDKVGLKKKTKGSQHQSQKNGWQVRHKVSRIKALSPLLSSLAIFTL